METLKGMPIAPRFAEGSYETLGGFVLEQFGHIPKPGEVFKYHNMTFTVLSADERSIGNVRIQIGKNNYKWTYNNL